MPEIDRERIFLGCGNFGGVGSLPELKGRGESSAAAFDLLDEAKAYGIFQFDTANSYGAGESEKILGHWLANRTRAERAHLRVATKVGNPHGTRQGGRPLSRREILFHLDESLTRLGLEQIAIYYLHEPDPVTPLEETLEALSQATDQGKIAAFGLSNADVDYVTRILRLCDENLRQKLRYVQNEFHYLHQADRADLLPLLEREKIAYIAFSPLAGGLLSGKYLGLSLPPAGSRLALRSEPYERYKTDETSARIGAFVKDALVSGQKPAARALQFVLETPGVHGAVIGPRRKDHYVSLGFRHS